MVDTTQNREHLPRTPAGSGLQAVTTTAVQRAITRYTPISLADMNDVALQSRTDTKFVMRAGTLLRALRALPADYRVLEVAGVRLHHYETLYFDTADFTLYRRHHAGAANRYKVRARAYVESDLAFFEVKQKTAQKRTVKHRLQTETMQTQVKREAAEFLTDHFPYEPAALLPVLWNRFTRITLVSNHRPERLTLDLDISFRQGMQQAGLSGIAIAEVKREGFTQMSDFIRQMRRFGVRPSPFSKYALGAGALYPQLKQNRFKQRNLLIQKLIQGGSHDRHH